MLIAKDVSWFDIISEKIIELLRKGKEKIK